MASTRPLGPLSPAETEVRGRLRSHIEVLSERIGGRDAQHPEALSETLDYLENELSSFGYGPSRQKFSYGGQDFVNLEAERIGAKHLGAVVCVGAHYDTAGGLPGANDNGSGVAATLELAHQFATLEPSRTLRFLFFANEEPPYFQTDGMGSYVYAKRCRERHEDITAMLSLETIGYYSDQPGSQNYPVGLPPIYPDRGDFLSFVSDLRSVLLLRAALKAFRNATSLPAEGAAGPTLVPGIGWSDHWSFWQFGYRALMVTDTAPYRYPYYHSAEDTPDKLDYDRLSRAFTGIAALVRNLTAA